MRVVAFVCAAALGAMPSIASQDARVNYDLSIAGVPIGDAWMSVARSDDRYALTAAADVGFLFWGGSGQARVEGSAIDGRFTPDSYRLHYSGLKKPGSVEIDFVDGKAVRWERQPPISSKYAKGRLPLEAPHVENVLDPLTALTIPAPADVEPDELCRRVLPVFSGYTRFDLELTGSEAVDGGAVACRAAYRAVAGHRPDSKSVKRMGRPDALRLSLAPIAQDVWAPSRVTVATKYGDFEAVRR